MTSRKILYVILVLSALSLIVATYLNIKLFVDYSNSTGKSHGLFGLSEVLNYGYRWYFAIIPVFAIVVSLYKSRYKELRFLSLTIILISIMAIICSLFSVWRLYI